MTTSSAVHREGVAAFASLPGDSFAYRIDYADADGRVWLKSSATDCEWCVLISLSVAVQAHACFFGSGRCASVKYIREASRERCGVNERVTCCLRCAARMGVITHC